MPLALQEGIHKGTGAFKMSLVNKCLGSNLAFEGLMLANFFSCSSATPLTLGLGEPSSVSIRNPSKFGSWKKPLMLCVRNCKHVVRRSKASDAISESSSSTVSFFRLGPQLEAAAEELSDRDISLPVELPVELSRLRRVASIRIGWRLLSLFCEPEEAKS